MDTPSGPQMMKAPAFSFPPPVNPEGLVQIAQHLTPNWCSSHGSCGTPTARAVTESIVCASDPEQYARKYSLYTGYDYERADGYFEVNLGARSRVTVVDPGEVASIVPGGAAPAIPSLVGFTVLVADLDHVAALLDRNGMPFQAAGTRLVLIEDQDVRCGWISDLGPTGAPDGLRGADWPPPVSGNVPVSPQVSVSRLMRNNPR